MNHLNLSCRNGLLHLSRYSISCLLINQETLKSWFDSPADQAAALRIQQDFLADCPARHRQLQDSIQRHGDVSCWPLATYQMLYRMKDLHDLFINQPAVVSLCEQGNSIIPHLEQRMTADPRYQSLLKRLPANVKLTSATNTHWSTPDRHLPYIGEHWLDMLSDSGQPYPALNHLLEQLQPIAGLRTAYRHLSAFHVSSNISPLHMYMLSSIPRGDSSLRKLILNESADSLLDSYQRLQGEPTCLTDWQTFSRRIRNFGELKLPDVVDRILNGVPADEEIPF